MTDRSTVPAWALVALLAVPILGLGLLLARPELDIQWEHHPSHFWLVLLTAAVNVVLAYLTNVAAGRYRDARLVLVSLAFLASAGFLGLHALATPGRPAPPPEHRLRRRDADRAGHRVASSRPSPSVRWPDRERRSVLRWRRGLLGGLIGRDGCSGASSRWPGCRRSTGRHRARRAPGPLEVAGRRGRRASTPLRRGATSELYRRRGGIVPLTVAVAFVLLAEAMIAVVVQPQLARSAGGSGTC